MQVVVDIPNWLYHAIQEHREPIYSQSLGEAVRDGTPLPKGVLYDKENATSVTGKERKIADNERTCELVKIVATSDIGKPLANDKVTYLLDKQTMTVYAPWANCEMLYALGLTIVDLPKRSE